MKKFNLLILSLLSLISLSGCNNKPKQIHIDKRLDIDSLVWIDGRELVNKISTKKDFVLLIGQQGCLSCTSLLPVLQEYIKESQNVIYWIEASDYLDAVDLLKANEEYHLNPLIESASLHLFDDGLLSKTFNYQEKMYSSLSSLKNTLSSYVSSSNYYLTNDLVKTHYIDDISMYQIDDLGDSYLEELIKRDNSTILFTLTSCPDCKLFKESFLDEYLIKNNKKLFIYEVDGIRSSKNHEPWENFKNKYQFSNYRNGRVPSLVTYSKSNKVDMKVFINDVITKEDDQYVITSSFYKECIGIKGRSQEECMKKASEVQIPLIEDYLNHYL